MLKLTKLTAYAVFAAAGLCVSLASCKKDDDNKGGTNNGGGGGSKEVIASMSIMLESDDDSTVRFIGWSDLDGPGGELPIYDAVSLKQNIDYTATFRFEDADGKNISLDVIKANPNNYKLCLGSSDLGFSATVLDKDPNNRDLGLQQKLRLTQTGTGSLAIVLKDQSGVKNGDCAPGTVWFSCNLPLNGN